MREFQADGRTISAYLAVPDHGSGPGVLVLHAWWGLTEPFRQVCDRLAEAGFVALAPDLYRGKTAATVEEAQALGAALDRDVERVRGDIAGAVQFLRQHDASNLAWEAPTRSTCPSTWPRRSPQSLPFMPPTPDRTIAARRPHTSATSRRMTPSSRRSRERRWSRRSRLRGGRSPSIRIRGPHIGSSRRIALSMMPRLLAWPGSGPLRSCTSGLSKRESVSERSVHA